MGKVNNLNYLERRRLRTPKQMIARLTGIDRVIYAPGLAGWRKPAYINVEFAMPGDRRNGKACL
jgi:hypothetical protein